MRSTLDAEAETLDGLARGDLLLAFDLDGTLAPTVPDPPRTAMRESTRALAVRVGRTGRTAAHAYLPEQAVIDGPLRRLVRARRRAQGIDGDTARLERLLAIR